MGARWYNPGAGDFTSADSVQVSPVPDPAAGNPYAYAADNPLGGTDPTGHMLIPMLPDGGNYYRVPAPAKPVASPPSPYSPQQIVRAATITAPHRTVPVDAHKSKPPPRAVQAPSSLTPAPATSPSA
jgi:hypothetical protein